MLLISPIIGYRFWSLINISKKVYLSSTLVDIPWQYKECIEAIDIYENRPISRPDNTFPGVHAFKKGSIKRTYADLFGSVYLWGQVSEHTKGYRAEFAYPKNLIGVECCYCKKFFPFNGVFVNLWIRLKFYCDEHKKLIAPGKYKIIDGPKLLLDLNDSYQLEAPAYDEFKYFSTKFNL